MNNQHMYLLGPESIEPLIGHLSWETMWKWNPPDPLATQAGRVRAGGRPRDTGGRSPTDL